MGVLVAVALPSYLNSTAVAKAGAAETNARAISYAVQSVGVKNGTYPSAATGLADPSVVSDMGGAIPNDPCSASPGAAGYAYTDTSGTRASVAAKSDVCSSYSPKTFAVTLGG